MRKIKIIPIIALLLMMAIELNAVTIESYVDVTEVGLNDNFTLTIEVSGKDASKVKNVTLPKNLDFDVLGQSSSSSSSITIVNGKMERQSTKSFLYTLQPKKLGVSIIPPISLTFKGKTISTSPIRIVVSQKSNNNPAPRKSTNNNFFADPFTSNQSPRQPSGNNTFVIAKLDKKKVYVGEPIIVTYYLLTQDRLLNLSFGKATDFKGFWKEDLYTADKINFKKVRRNGQLFNQMLLTKVALTSNNPGKFKVPSLEMDVQISVPARSFFDFDSTRQLAVKSKEIPITVLPLPEKNKPQSFTGAIGQFSLEDSLNVNNLKVGDSFTYTIKIKGKGNFRQFDAPKLDNMNHFHFLDPEVKNYYYDKESFSGIKRVKYLVIAQEEGSYRIPKIEFSFFNPQTEKYVILETKPRNLIVEKGDKKVLPNGFVQSNISSEGRDVGFIYTTCSDSAKYLFYDSFVYWFLYLLSIITIFIIYFYSKEKMKLVNNEEYRRIKNAKKILKKYLKEAEEYSQKADKRFYSSSQTGISNYITDKLNLPRGSQTSEIYKELNKNGFSDVLDDLKSYFEICNRARFTSEEITKEKIENDEKKLRDLISKIQQI